MTEPDVDRDTLERLANLMPSITPIIDAVAGYAAQCRQAGFSNEAAENMATVLHAHLLHRIFTPKTPPPTQSAAHPSMRQPTRRPQ